MEKVAEYKMISENDFEVFNVAVNEAIKNGWQPYGSPFARAITTGAARYSQAFVKFEENYDVKRPSPSLLQQL